VGTCACALSFRRLYYFPANHDDLPLNKSLIVIVSIDLGLPLIKCSCPFPSNWYRDGANLASSTSGWCAAILDFCSI